MEVRAFAEQILFGRTLADKLVHPASLTDHQPGDAINTPKMPYRPANLQPVRRTQNPFPSIAHLDRAGVRGDILHRFANHELLAMEIMSLVLLRFPNAPPAFRRGIVSALREEQTHFTLYLNRMAECGVSLGDVPTSPYFWDILSPMATPLDFVVGMSLTFEQANLDYAGYYRQAFAKAGDAQTAAVLDRIYEDEIGHVKLGLIWFRRWLDPSDDWQSYTQALPDTLHPGRAKGLGFDAKARQRAGFDSTWIERLRVFTRSKGRVPSVHWFDPTAEMRLAGQVPSAKIRRLQRDLDTLPMFLCARDDVVLVNKIPRPAFLKPLESAGFLIPEFATHAALIDRRLDQARPWAGVPAPDDLRPVTVTPRHLFGKDWAASQLRELLPTLDAEVVTPAAFIGIPCERIEAVRAAYASCLKISSAVVAKAAFSTAGQGIQRLDRRWPSKWLAKMLRGGPIVVEPWLDRVLDLGIQLRVEPKVRFDGVTRNLVDDRGRHQGVALFKMSVGLPEDLRRWLMGHPVQGALKATAEWVGQALAEAGYRGAASVDVLVHRVESGYRLKPIVEINPRNTMGRIAMRLRRRLTPRTYAIFIQTKAQPIETHLATRGTPPQITDACLSLTDPTDAEFTTTLHVAPSLAELQARVTGLRTIDPVFHRSIQCSSRPNSGRN